MGRARGEHTLLLERAIRQRLQRKTETHGLGLPPCLDDALGKEP